MGFSLIPWGTRRFRFSSRVNPESAAENGTLWSGGGGANLIELSNGNGCASFTRLGVLITLALPRDWTDCREVDPFEMLRCVDDCDGELFPASTNRNDNGFFRHHDRKSLYGLNSPSPPSL
jgi:hypothetical protein